MSHCAKEHHRIDVLNWQSGDEVYHSVVVIEGKVDAGCHDGRFQAPENEDNSIESACDRISTGIRLVQSLIAEQLNKFGYGRNTFQLQSDLDPGAPDCHVFYSKIPVEEAHAANGDTLWGWIGRELMTSHLGNENYKFVAFLSSTHYEGKTFNKFPPTHDEIVECTRGHVAIGGGGLALLHTGCLHTWATSAEEVVARLSSSSLIDTAFFMDGSNRGTYGGCYSSSLGAVAHELGHTFDLGHTTHGIMGPEYHDIHYMFLPEECEVVDSPAKSSLSRKSYGAYEDKRICKTKSQSPALKACLPPPHAINEENEISVMMFQELRVAWKAPEPLSKNITPSDSCTALLSDSPDPKTDLENHRKTVTAIRNHVHIYKADVKNQDDFHPTLDKHDISPLFAQSSLGLLAFNRWINPNGTKNIDQSITYDQVRRQVSSLHGLRIIDVRDATCKSLLHWKFLQSHELQIFVIPEQYISPDAFSLCVVDSLGNVLKHDLHKQEPEPNIEV
ncbi:hypothetical protein ONE63_005409 [Megalurothrips usitatus]|uniref:Zinc metalloproteinase YIL108W n=1 Tax=Megalurothrips usitatus TaxID=439358 RepID=A0AAV7XZ94_9NEOP|nr:hypothetical protein ONE63_005409 [Megalurothrips usitatus]